MKFSLTHQDEDFCILWLDQIQHRERWLQIRSKCVPLIQLYETYCMIVSGHPYWLFGCDLARWVEQGGRALLPSCLALDSVPIL